MVNPEVGVESRPRSASQSGIGPWVRQNLFSSWFNSCLTVALFSLLVATLVPALSWGVLHAVFRSNLAACHAAEGIGACWGVVAEKGRLILFGRYPFGEQWRPLTACLLLVVLLVVSCFRRTWRPALAVAWLIDIGLFYVLMHGGTFEMSIVDTALWGGLPLTLLLSTLSLLVAFPLALLLTLGRASHLSAIRLLCILFIEITRGVPLIGVLFMASFVLPLFLPEGDTFDVVLRVLVGMTLFTAAYLAEVVRGGLQALPLGQIEAAQSLGLGYWKTQQKIVLPQALRLVVPAIVNTFIGAFKDTSLVTIVSLYDLTGAVQLALGDPQWRRFFLEGEFFVAGIYLVVCLALSTYSRRVERDINVGVNTK